MPRWRNGGNGFLGVSSSLTATWRALKKLDLPSKKKILRACEQAYFFVIELPMNCQPFGPFMYVAVFTQSPV